MGNFNDPVMRAKILPYIIDKIMVDDDNLAINIFFSDERREENVESILAKIKAYEDYEQSIKNKKLDISDEEFVRMALGNVPDMDKAMRLFQSLCKLIIADIRYVNSSVAGQSF